MYFLVGKKCVSLKCLVLFGCGGRAKNLFDKKRKKNLRNQNIRPKVLFAENLLLGGIISNEP